MIPLNVKEEKDRENSVSPAIEAFFGKNENASNMSEEEIQILHRLKVEYFRRRCAANPDYGHLHITP